GLQWGVDVDRNFDARRTRANLYLQDRAAMKGGNFTGIAGIPTQDIAMWESMGPITDRSSERLGASDVAVAAFRRLMVEAARDVQNGGGGGGTTPPPTPHPAISSFERGVPKNTNQRRVGGRGGAPPRSGAQQR